MVETIKNEPRVINDFRANGQQMPFQNKIRQFIEDNPNCKLSDIYKYFNEVDDAGIRRAIRKMILSHQIIQRFSRI